MNIQFLMKNLQKKKIKVLHPFDSFQYLNGLPKYKNSKCL